jgi:histidine triad (HIT) family protein
MSEHCVFCEIALGRAAASIVYDDDQILAFMDLRPITTGHLLVVPRKHAESLADLDSDDGAQMFRVAQRLAAAIRASEVRSDGVNLFLADGEAAGQEVFHVHLHVLPRYPGDGFRLQITSAEPSRAELDDLAAQLRQAK